MSCTIGSNQFNDNRFLDQVVIGLVNGVSTDRTLSTVADGRIHDFIKTSSLYLSFSVVYWAWLLILLNCFLVRKLLFNDSLNLKRVLFRTIRESNQLKPFCFNLTLPTSI